MLTNISKGLIRGKSAFLTITPSPMRLFKVKWISYLLPLISLAKGAIRVVKNETSTMDFIADDIGIYLGNRISRYILLGKINTVTSRTFSVVQERPNWKLLGLGATRRTWVTVNDKSFIDQRIVKKLVIIYHDANKAGRHIDVHLGHLSLVYRVTSKPFENDIRFSNQGRLTEASKQLLLNHVRQEIAKNARVPQNHDHTIKNAKMDWSYDAQLTKEKGYGAGPTRQIIAEDTVEFYHPEVTSSLHMYAPILNPDQGLYLYKIHDGKTPILIFGKLIPLDDNYKDRLHLKLIPTLKEFKSKVDIKTTTIKEDGASCYFSSNGQGFKFFSPRFSSVTGHRIEYSFKLAELADKGHPMNPQGMGELLFYKKLLWLKQYLTAAEIGGILNSNQVRPRNIYPDLKVYRMDKWNSQSVIDLPFFENRSLQQQMIKDLGSKWNIVKLASPRNNSNIEGYVATTKGGSILEGSKVKFKDNEFDWKIDSINLSITDKNRIAGVINCTSLESGKQYNLGPGSIGTQDECLKMISKPLDYVGKVIKVSGYRQHEGRAAKLISYHLDK